MNGILRKLAFLTLVILMAGCGDRKDCTLKRDIHYSRLDGNESEITRIIDGMTLEEKVAMLHGKHMFTSAGVPSQGVPDMIYADGPFGVREEMEPYSWNPLHMSNDSATFFPTGSALAATWDEDIAFEYGKGVGIEARLRGKDMMLGPAINIQRIPNGGRTFEYLSEDPFLSARLAVGYVRGMQEQGVAACVKHFALNNQETNRNSVNVLVSPRAMREIYLPPFEAAVVEGDAFGVMSAYNKINGTWCGENSLLLDQILRKDWGFKGMVISDWGGTHSTVESVMAGLNVEMPDSAFHGKALLDSVRSGAVPESVIDERVREILRVRLVIDPIPEDDANVVMTGQPEQAEIAYRVALKSVVMLKNQDNMLPLQADSIRKIAVIGDNADKKMSNGGVGAGVKALYEITPLAGLRNRIGDKAEIVYAQGYTSQQMRGMFGGFGMRPGAFGFPGMRRPAQQQDNTADKLLDEAVAVAQDADVVLFIGGDNRQWETEGSDRQSLALPYGQEKVLKAVSEVNPNIVFVVVAGAPVDLNVVDSCSMAIVQSWFNGTEGGNALADILLGTYAPAGRLPFSYPLHLEDTPAYVRANSGPTDPQVADYAEDMMVGYRWYDGRQKPVMYPFGYGLTYTDFEYGNMTASKSRKKGGDCIDVTFTLKNTGNVAADEVAQLYVHRINAMVVWPYRELKAFKRVSLEAGETKTVTLTVPAEQLKYWSEENHDWMLEHGQICLMLGSNVNDVRLSSTVDI